jgi:hypothetical protein
MWLIQERGAQSQVSEAQFCSRTGENMILKAGNLVNVV